MGYLTNIKISMINRTNNLRKILEVFGDDFDILKGIKNGEVIAPYLRDYAVIYPSECNAFLNTEIKTLRDLMCVMSDAREFVGKKEEYYALYMEYVSCFLGDGDERHENCAIGVEGKIDYTPYLESLGISDITKLHPDFVEHSDGIPEQKKKKIPYPGLKLK